MDTPVYLKRLVKPDGTEAVTGSSARPRTSNLPGKPYIAVVFNGRGRVLDWFAGESEGEAGGAALRAYVERDRQWTALGAAGKPRVADPPMWDLYLLFAGRYVRQRSLPPAAPTADPVAGESPAPAPQFTTSDSTTAVPSEPEPQPTPTA